MTDDELEQARDWAETVEPYPVKRGFLTLLAEIDRLRKIEARAIELSKTGNPDDALYILGEADPWRVDNA